MIRFKVEYLLNEEQYSKLVRITNLFRERHRNCSDISIEKMFSLVMEVGYIHDVNEHLDYFMEFLGEIGSE